MNCEPSRAIQYPIYLALLLIIACHETPSSAPPSSTDSHDVIKETVSEVRDARLRVQLRLPDAGPPSASDLTRRRTLEEKIEHDRIGTIVDESIGAGYVDFTVQVPSSVTAIPKINAIVREARLTDRTVVTVTR
jgi:hypothetical protein